MINIENEYITGGYELLQDTLLSSPYPYPCFFCLIQYSSYHILTSTTGEESICILICPPLFTLLRKHDDNVSLVENSSTLLLAIPLSFFKLSKKDWEQLAPLFY